MSVARTFASDLGILVAQDDAHNDKIKGDAGNDRLIWSAGDGSVVFEGGEGFDTAEVNGDDGVETFIVKPNGTRVLVDYAGIAPSLLDIGTIEAIVVNAGGGSDIVTVADGVSALTQITVDGGAGDDRITGAEGNEVLLGGDGNDTVTGGLGDDKAMLGAGDDVFSWSAGDGNDLVEGQSGVDTLRITGSNANQNVSISSRASRVNLSHDLGAMALDLNGIERIDLLAFGGADSIVIGDLSGSDVVRVDVDLASSRGGGDHQPDRVTRQGSSAADVIRVSAAVGGVASVSGLQGLLTVKGIEALNDTLVVDGAGGDDRIDATGAEMESLRLVLDGGAGNDTVTGSKLRDLVRGGDGDDLLQAGLAGDQVFGDAGADRIVWNAGDGNDTIDGGEGIDTLEIRAGDDTNFYAIYTIHGNGSHLYIEREFDGLKIDTVGVERLVFRGEDGRDTITVGTNLNAAMQSITIDGGAGSDNITGGYRDDVLIGGDGNDVITGGRGSDIAEMGEGNDVFVWHPGDGNDTVDGGPSVDYGDPEFNGRDTLRLNGSESSEPITISMDGGRVNVFRDLGSGTTLALTDIEQIYLSLRGGADTLVVNDVSGTRVDRVRVNLSADGGIESNMAVISGTGDSSADTVVAEGRAAAELIDIVETPWDVRVTGLAAEFWLSYCEAGDTLQIDGLGGADFIRASSLRAGALTLRLDGGAGNDTIRGSQGIDTLIGGDGDDDVEGHRGDDAVLLGAGDDRFVWRSGDGSDTVDGEAGADALYFHASNESENLVLQAHGSGAFLQCDAGGVTMDLSGIETIELSALGGSDNILVADLVKTGITNLKLHLSGASGGAGDSLADVVTLVASAASSHLVVASSGATTLVTGLAAAVSIDGFDPKGDRLVLRAGAAADLIDASSLSTAWSLEVDAGDGADKMIGSAGSDTVTGGGGSDLALLGAGDDRFIWSPGHGSDTVEGQSGVDSLLMNGSSAAERIEVSASGGRVKAVQGAASIDLGGVERIELTPLGGADSITVTDLSNSGIRQVVIDLGTAAGAGDGQADVVELVGSPGSDKIVVTVQGGDLIVTGLAMSVLVRHFDAGIDQLRLLGAGGNDTIDASSILHAVVLDGGDGNDVLLGGFGSDALIGGLGDDLLVGGAAIDLLVGGLGNNILIQ